MGQILTKEAKDFLKSNNQVLSEVADELGIGVISLPQYIGRDSKRLIEFPILSIIAKAMNKEPEEILEEVETVAK
jgi:hypothetical protein